MKSIKTKEAVRFLKSQGWTIKRSNGRHDVWGSQDGKQIFPLGRHNDVSPGVMKQMKDLFPDLPKKWM